MDKPKIVLNGKIYTPANPKCAAWRAIVHLKFHDSDVDVEDYMDEMAGVIAKCFDDKAVTKQAIIDNMPLEDIKPAFENLYKWMIHLVNSKLETIPNGEAAAEKD